MSLDPNEIYVISSAIASAQTVILRPESVSDKKEPVLTVETTSQPKWRLHETKPGSHTYIVALADNDSRRLFVENNLLWLVTTDKGTEFSIEPAGVNLYRLHIPDENKVARANTGKQVDIAVEDGTTKEQWYFTVWHHG
ncbi:hypothetical protein K435DRAFT_796570 [Dendrothele bispora CBS 962.96]|uniref:Ricin B lectin domain-containing protein n=1 Tax=Dendrothele bispora (strain CBS 962.96) TaxID=1314807 RepID=A0A4S8M561_DENBC|nr:hypothetical protein K435DRAFT_796569 [Dendrothele bispora CBS 962.96]THU97360.1 hypothetical protein K435DRAFT_796570 [Dendrothele bispora CBS 962.96]